MVRLDLTLQDGTKLGTCWHKAVFQSATTQETDRAAVDAAQSSCVACSS
jgi:hypothetical protein